MKRKYPRATLRRIMKGKRNVNISKSADLAVSSSFSLAEKNKRVFYRSLAQLHQ